MESRPPVASPISFLWTPLVVVTAAHDGQRSGQVAVSVHNASIVPDHPRLLAGLWKGNLTRDLVERSGAFAVHILRADQGVEVAHFGLQSGHEIDKLASRAHTVGATGTPLLEDCMAVYECRALNAMDAGDHTIFLGDVVYSRAGEVTAPLQWHDLRDRVPAEFRERWEQRSARAVAVARLQMDNLPQWRPAAP